MGRSVMQWGQEEVRHWLAEVGLAKYTGLLVDEHQLDGPALLMLTEGDLRQPPLQVKHAARHMLWISTHIRWVKNRHLKKVAKKWAKIALLERKLAVLLFALMLVVFIACLFNFCIANAV